MFSRDKFGLLRSFKQLRECDEDKNGQVFPSAFKAIVNKHFRLGPRHKSALSSLVSSYSTGFGKFDYYKWMAQVRPNLNYRRIRLSKELFDKLDAFKKGKVSLKLLVSRFKPSFHPSVFVRESFPENVFKDFDEFVR